MRRLVRLAAACGVLAGCTRPPPTAPPEAPPEATAGPDAPIRHARGEVLGLTVPLLGGDAVTLAALRGRVVVLELTAASAPSWPARFTLYNRLLRDHGADQLAVLVVALDPERAALSPEPALRAHGFELGWDPQGALAARLQAAVLPLVLVLDRAGRIVHIGGGPDAAAALEDAVVAALAAPAVRAPHDTTTP